MSPTAKEISFIALIIALGVCLFLLGRQSNIHNEVIEQPNVDKYLRTIDSLERVNKINKDSIVVFRRQFDSLSTLKVNNHKKVTNAINKIRVFNPTSRERWNDSVLTAKGLK